MMENLVEFQIQNTHILTIYVLQQILVDICFVYGRVNNLVLN